MDRSTMQLIDLGLVVEPYGELPRQSANNKQTTERASILAATEKDTVAERGNPLRSFLKQSSRSHNSNGHLFRASLH